MLDQNTDRMWNVIGAVLLGGLLIAGAVIMFNDTVFAGIEDTFKILMHSVSEPEIPNGYVLATDDDFKWIEYNHTNAYFVDNESKKGYYHYEGDDPYVVVPRTINGNSLRNTFFMFNGIKTNLKGVAMDSPNVVQARYMFYDTQLSSLDLSGFSTKRIIRFDGMFEKAIIDNLDLSYFDTSAMTSTSVMFNRSIIKNLNLKNWNTSRLTNMSNMFWSSKIDVLDLSDFELSTDVLIVSLFDNTSAKQVYVRSQKEYNLLNQPITKKPNGLIISIK